jgi:sec-independent protein translocase protein TatA
MMNHVLGLGMPGTTETLLVLGVVLLMFGGTRLPQLAKGLGSSIREFKKGAAGLDEAPALNEAAARTDGRLD